jgi:molybdate transport system regulatory protein
MNALSGEIETLDVSGNLTLVGLRVGECNFKSIVVDTPETVKYLQIGGTVKVLFKETEVIIGTGEHLQISLRNKMKASITTIEKGKLLAKLIMQTNAGEVISIITTNAVNQLELKEGSSVLAMVKTNEILLAPC